MCSFLHIERSQLRWFRASGKDASYRSASGMYDLEKTIKKTQDKLERLKPCCQALLRCVSPHQCVPHSVVGSSSCIFSCCGTIITKSQLLFYFTVLFVSACVIVGSQLVQNLFAYPLISDNSVQLKLWIFVFLTSLQEEFACSALAQPIRCQKSADVKFISVQYVLVPA